MRRLMTMIVVVVGTILLAGCVYDPYTHQYVPCCAYPAYYGPPAYYGYPAPYGYPGYYGGGGYVGGGYYR